MANLVSGQTVEMADKAIKASMPSEVGRDTGISSCCPVSTHPKKDPGGATMRAVQYSTTKSVAMNQCPKPAITDDQDCIVKTTMSALCGTDLHLFLGYIPGVSKGMIIGHEAMGVVESVGPKVKNIKPGDRVIVSCQIACGECVYCKDKMFSLCDATNPVSIGEELMGQRTAALLGFNKITAGLDGAQADYVRVPIADVNCLVVPKEDSNLSDEKLLFLSDILCTSWFGTELAEVKENDVVAIWGAGPVGLLAAQCSFARGARRVILVDNVAYRLEFAKKILPKIETVDFSKENGSAGEKKVLELCKDEKYHAPDCCIECVGMHYAHSMVHRMEMAVGLETDTPEALNAAIFACRKGGHIGSIGAYAGMCNHFNIGALMMKNISLKSGPIPVQKYWHELYDMIKEGKLDPSVIITHRMSLEDAPKAYQIFNEKLDDVVKVVFTDFDRSAVVEGGKTA